LAARPRTFAAQPEGRREIYEPGRARPQRYKGPVTAAPLAGEIAAPAAGVNSIAPSFGGFQGLQDDFTAIPPDTTGAVGPQHIVTMLNTQVQIQSRSGVVRANYPINLGGASGFWSPLGVFTDVFDPRILYDPASDRWIASAVINAKKTTSAVLLAVSQTGDPGSKWTFYKYVIGSAGNWADYPVLGFNRNWVAISINLFGIKGGNYVNTRLLVFSKSDLYQGGNGSYVSFSDQDGELIPAQEYDNSHPGTFYFMQALAADAGFRDGVGAIRISKLQGSVGSETFSGGNGGVITINDPWSDGSTNAAGGFAPQQDTSTRIDTGDSRLQNCLLRGGTIWCAHTIFLPYAAPARTAVQWFQVDPAVPQILQRGRIDDPAGVNFYAYPSIAVNSKNDALLGYSRFTAGGYGTAMFSYRASSDPLNAMSPGILFKSGEAAYVSFGTQTGDNRWGDFSSTWVDPADDLTFWTIQEYASSPPQGETGKFGTWWAQVTAPSAARPCNYSLNPASQTFTASGGFGTITVTANAGCLWMAASNAPWISVTAGSTGSGSGTVGFTIAPNSNPASTQTGTISIASQTWTVTQQASVPPQKPTFPAQGVVNAASYLGGGVAPGEVVTVFGTNFGPTKVQQPVVNSTAAVGNVAGGTQVVFDGTPAPMVSAINGQVTAVVPFAVQGKASTQVLVAYLGVSSDPVTVPVVASAPGIFSLNASGKGPGAILNQDFSINGATNAAKAGTAIMIYATGGGVMSPAPAEGTLAQPPFSTLPLNNVALHIGGVPAQVLYAGEAPGLIVGVLQINAVVPAGSAAGAAVPIEITINGVTSPAGVTVAIQ